VSVSRRLVSGLILATGLTAVITARQQRALEFGASAFEGYIELLRQQAQIPGLSGLLIKDGAIVWERGLGFANLESRIPARPDTPYVIGDLTGPFTAVLVSSAPNSAASRWTGRSRITAPQCRTMAPRSAKC
jgi:CubicO group peptidase (beta-lactamase class C family)